KQHGERENKHDADKERLPHGPKLLIENMRGNRRKQNLHRLERDGRTKRTGKFKELIGERARPEFADDHVVNDKRAEGDQAHSGERHEIETCKPRLPLARNIVAVDLRAHVVGDQGGGPAHDVTFLRKRPLRFGASSAAPSSGAASRLASSTISRSSVSCRARLRASSAA